jgi:hypothetical protein
MADSYTQYDPHLKQTILQQYQKGVRGHGFQALANKYNIKGGAMAVSYWFNHWDGTESSLTKHSGGDRRSILTPEEKKKYIKRFVDKKSKTEASIYAEVLNNVEKKTKKSLTLRTVQRDGKALGISSKKRKRVTKNQGLHTFNSLFVRSNNAVLLRCL